MTDTLHLDPVPGDADDIPPAPAGPTREERAAQRAATLRRRRIVGAVIAGVAVLLAAAAAYVLWFTSLLGLDDVQVTASEGSLDPALQAAVAEVVAVEPGTPLIRVDLAGIRDRVDALPGVEEATVARRWPGTVTVTVTPRVPVAVVAANSALYLVDATGLPYETVAAKPAGLVSLRLATPGPADPATLAGVAVAQALPAGLISQVTSVTAAGAYDITLQLTDGRTVIWGDTTDTTRKAQILPAVLDLDGTTFDISDPELVTTR